MRTDLELRPRELEPRWGLSSSSEGGPENSESRAIPESRVKTELEYFVDGSAAKTVMPENWVIDIRHFFNGSTAPRDRREGKDMEAGVLGCLRTDADRLGIVQTGVREGATGRWRFSQITDGKDKSGHADKISVGSVWVNYTLLICA
ncbi:hypothetical protein B0H14DRAFT_2589489 [Mycena olivaceomarginata]|nr:hypothetical protein B0H14DRAFT_2589489 [Mycena olivaceomarginata]